MPNENQPTDFVTALARGLDVLQAFSRDQPELTLTEVAQKTGLSAATARRSLHTLRTLGYIAVNGRRFLLTPRVLKLSLPFFASMNLQEVAQQYLQDIVEKTGDSSSVTILDGTDVVYIATVSAKRPSQISTTLGTRFPAHVTALGRVLLAHLDTEVLEHRIAQMAFQPYTENSVRNGKDLKRILARVRRDRYAGIEEEWNYGVVAVAVPIEIDGGRVVAAVNCSAASPKISLDSMIETRLPLLRTASRQIATALRQYPTLVHSILG